MVQEAVQTMIYICAYVVSSKQLGVVNSYREYVEKLMEAGLMNQSLGGSIKTMIILRNRLTYRYLAVEPGELWSWAVKLTSEIAPKFKEWILKVIIELRAVGG